MTSCTQPFPTVCQLCSLMQSFLAFLQRLALLAWSYMIAQVVVVGSWKVFSTLSGWLCKFAQNTKKCKVHQRRNVRNAPRWSKVHYIRNFGAKNVVMCLRCAWVRFLVFLSALFHFLELLRVAPKKRYTPIALRLSAFIHWASVAVV